MQGFLNLTEPCRIAQFGGQMFDRYEFYHTNGLRLWCWMHRPVAAACCPTSGVGFVFKAAVEENCSVPNSNFVSVTRKIEFVYDSFQIILKKHYLIHSAKRIGGYSIQYSEFFNIRTPLAYTFYRTGWGVQTVQFSELTRVYWTIQHKKYNYSIATFCRERGVNVS